MRKICSILLVFCMSIFTLVLPGCQWEDKTPKEPLGDNYYGAEHKIADFSKGLSSSFHAANGWTNGGMFDCRWRSQNVVYNSSKKTLELALTYDEQAKENNGGEYRTNAHYGYGYYAVKMKAISKPGVISSFFTYTGRSEGNNWDEIDIEFLGKDTTKVQFNYFTNGVGGHEFIYDLGFDASKELHEYGFHWAKDSITWYVDNVPVYRAREEIPVTKGRIMINAWPGVSSGNNSVANWSGVFDGKYPVASAEYEWISFQEA